MGFFSDLKEDLAVAVDELVPEDGEDVIRTSETATMEEDMQTESAIREMGEEDDFQLEEMLDKLDTMNSIDEMDFEEEAAAETAAEEIEAEVETEAEEIEAEAETEVEETEEAAIEADTEAEETVETESIEAEETVETENIEAEEKEVEEAVAESEARQESLFTEADILEALTQDEEKTQNEGAEKEMETMTNRTISDETAVITQGMVITGDLVSEGSVDLIGTINGNIDILGKLNITGKITGNSKASEIFADGAKINGEIVCDGPVKIGQSSVIIGDITATSAVIAGAVKGDIDVKGPVILDTSAIVMGNIKSKSVQINNGAVIEGMCSQCYADVNPTSFFEDLIK